MITTIFVRLFQLFAAAGDVLNGTQGYTNSSTGVVTPFPDSMHTMAPEMKVYYDTVLLKNARMDQVYAQFATKQRLPRNHGMSVEWRKPNTFAKAEKLQEGVIPTGQKFGVSSITAGIYQMGTYAAITDILDTHAYDPLATIMTEEMGASAKETQETLIRDALLANTNVFYCENITIATGAVASTPKQPSEMEDSATTKCYLTEKAIMKIATAMKKNKVPKIRGGYVMVLHPSVAEDLRASKEWKEAHQYADPNPIFSGEIGQWHNIRFIEDVDAPVMKDDYKNKAGGATYANYVFGADAFGIIDPEGGALEMIHQPREIVGGPLKQFETLGYKFETNGATVLYPERVMRVMCCSSYSATDDANYDPDFYPAED